MESLASLADYGSDGEGSSSSGIETQSNKVAGEEVFAQDGYYTDEPAAKRSKTSNIDNDVDSFLAEISEDLDKIPESTLTESKENNEIVEEEEDIDGTELPPDAIPDISTVSVPIIENIHKEDTPPPLNEQKEQTPPQESVDDTKEPESVVEEKPREPTPPPEPKLPYFKLANRCANAMKSTLNVRSIQLDEYGGFRVYLRYDDVPIAVLCAMGQNESEIVARRTACKQLVDEMFNLGLFPPNAKQILADKVTTIEKMIEVVRPVLSYLKFQLSDQKYQKMLRDDKKMGLKTDCTHIQLTLATSLINQIRFFTYRFYAEPTNNPWLHLAPANSVAPSAYTMPQIPISNQQSSSMESSFNTTISSSSSTIPACPPILPPSMKLTILEDDPIPVSVPPPVSTIPSPFTLPSSSCNTSSSSSLGFQSEFVRTVAVMPHRPAKDVPLSAAMKICVPKHEMIADIVERTIAAMGLTERNDTIMVHNNRKRAYLSIEEIPICIIGAMGESEKLSEAVSNCTHELMEQLCAWGLFPLDLINQICRYKDLLSPVLYSMSSAFNAIITTLREPQYMSLHRTQGLARLPHEAPGPHQAVAIGFRARIKNMMDTFWENHQIVLGPLIPLPKIEQWERVYFIHKEEMITAPSVNEEPEMIVSEENNCNEVEEEYLD